MSTLKALHSATGRCACGAVTYACSVESETALCSCDICRRSSGSGFQGWVNGTRKSLAVQGALSSWASTDHSRREFCPRCGSTLFLFERDEPEVVEVATGTLDEPDGVTSNRVSTAYAHKRPAWAHDGGSKP